MRTEGPRRRFLRSRALGALAVVVAGLLAAALLEGGLRGRWAAERLPDRGLRWIWDGLEGPHAFYAVRDFELPGTPPAATLLIQADQGYRVFLNGFWVAAGRYQPERWHAYQVDDWLYPGGNRLAVELRTSVGAGGMLLCLQLEGESGCRVRSDATWRIFERERRGVVEGWRRSAAGDPPRVWGPPPTGRWPLPRGVVERPAVVSCLDGGRRRGTASPAASPFAGDSGHPIPAWEVRWDPPATGYLEVATSSRLALLDRDGNGGTPALGLTPGSTLEALRGARAVVGTEPQVWSRVRIYGVLDLGAVTVHTLDPACDELLAAPAVPLEGILGLRWPPLRTPVEDKLRREF